MAKWYKWTEMVTRIRLTEKELELLSKILASVPTDGDVVILMARIEKAKRRILCGRFG